MKLATVKLTADPSTTSGIPGHTSGIVRSIFLVFLLVTLVFNVISSDSMADAQTARFDLNSVSPTVLLKIPGLSEDIVEIIVLYRKLKGGFSSLDEFFDYIDASTEERMMWSQLFFVRDNTENAALAAGPEYSLPVMTEEASESIVSEETPSPVATEPLAASASSAITAGNNGLPSAPAKIPSAPQGADSFRFCVISDTNGSYGSIAQGAGVGAAMKVIIGKLKPELVIHNGDMVAGQSRKVRPDRVRAMWKGYFSAVQEPLAKAGIPLVPVAGNHDAAPGFPDREIFREVWNDSRRVPALEYVDRDSYPLFYSFRHKGSLFVVLGGCSGKFSTREAALAAKLIRARSGGENLFVFNHVPFEKLYESEHGHMDAGGTVRKAMEEAGLSLLFTGHYEVYFKGYHGKIPIVGTGVLASVKRIPRTQKKPQGMSFICVDVAEGRLNTVFALKGPSFNIVFDESGLPEGFGHYRRFDVESGLMQKTGK